VAQVAVEPVVQRTTPAGRPTVRGKFLYVGDEKFWVRGVSYGTFYVDDDGQERLSPEVVERDFSQMAENGFNVVRTYTVPPRWLLDIAQKNGLRVMIGLNWPDHAAFLDEPGRVEEIENRVRRWVRACAGHAAVFCYCIGNEIPSSLVRWHGRRRVERFLRRLYRATKEEDPDALVTYVNYPTTEYLELPFLDFVCFNVFLESKRSLEDYIARLHSLSDERPVLLSEMGLDSLRNGEGAQAEALHGQIRSAFRTGCCGAIVFTWTDEWYRGGRWVEDWNFGLTARDRSAKPALEAVRKAFAESPFPPGLHWPKISVVVCSFNGASTIRDTMEALQHLDYPDFEAIVVNDGSTDDTPRIAAEYPVRLVSTENQGLSRARNVGIRAAQGEIVAFIDDDAYPDSHWLRYLAIEFMDGNLVGVGGPNLPPPNDGWKADAVGNAPGGPNVVLLSDRIAEHIPGCNMAFRKDALEAVGGFDPIFRVAGDDVDLCWRLRASDGVIGYAPAAVVWHHRRNSFHRYWKQQKGYGRAEALLERKWPEKYNVSGQMKWSGRIYGRGLSMNLSFSRTRVYHGVWGTAPFQSMYRSSSPLGFLTLTPEWYLMITLLALVFLLGNGWGPSIIFGLLLVPAVALPVVQAGMSALRETTGAKIPMTGWQRVRLGVAIFFLHLLQPLGRFYGRVDGGRTLRRRSTAPLRFLPMTLTLWREEWEAPEATLRTLQSTLREEGAIVRSGGDYDPWDLEIRGGRFGASRLLLAVEEHALGKQLVRFRIMPRYSGFALGLSGLLALISLGSGMSGAWILSTFAGVAATLFMIRTIGDTGYANGTLGTALKRRGAVKPRRGSPRSHPTFEEEP
jgi:GT2 family glycosyltransferase